VHTDRAIDVVIALGQGLDVGSVVGTDADAQEMPDPTLAGCISAASSEPSWAARSRRSR
jgi:hypothetical protein